MPDLFLNWGDLGPYGSSVVSGTTDTGGVNVAVSVAGVTEGDEGFTVTNEFYTETGEPFNPTSSLKLIGDNIEDPAGGDNDVSTTVIDFSSADAAFDDSVQNVSFRINDIDAGIDDVGDGATDPFADIVTVRAYDDEGNEIPVSFTPGSGVSVSGNTLTGTTQTGLLDGEGSVLVEIAGPVARIEIDYDNGGNGESFVDVSDVHFSTIDASNGDPIANDDTAETDEDVILTDIDVLGNDTDPDGDPLTVTGASASNGTVTINGDGTLNYDPDPDFNGDDTITYTVDDGNGGTDTGEVVVTVVPVNDDPVANDDTATTPADTLLEDIPVLDNDTDVDGGPLTVTGAGAPNGTVTVNSDGTLDYQPDPGFIGDDTITYDISDGLGGTDSGQVIVSVTDGDGNTPPVAVDDAESTDVGTPVPVDVLGNDSDPDGDAITVTDVTDGAFGTATVTGPGTIEYTPNPGFTGEDTVTYTIDDGNGGTDTADVIITVGSGLPLDGVVEGTNGDDTIDVGYTGDPEGDVVDGGDNIFDPDPEAADDDIIEAGGGNDVVEAGEDDDVVFGGTGDDTVDGGEGDDTLRGEQGEDVIDGGDGNDEIDGGADNDTITGGDGGDTVLGEQGDDLIDTSGPAPAIDVPTFPGIPVDADPENDRDLVFGGTGDDTIITGDDRDTIEAGDGNDVIESGIDDDEVSGGDGNDLITDTQGSDTIDGGGGADTIIAGVDTFSDYVGDDPNLPIGTILSDPNTDDGRDLVFGGAGNDSILTGDDADTIDGGTGNDTIDAGIDDDVIDGFVGNDSILGGHGSDTITGGEGDDFIDASAATSPTDFTNEPDATDPVPDNDRDVVDGGDGNDTILGGDDDDSLLGGFGDDVIDGGIDEDTIDGGEGADSLDGGDGADSILGGAGDDTITGGEGPDTIDAGDGRDSIVGGDDGDVVDGGSGPGGINPADGLPWDYDTLDLRGIAPPGGSVTVTYTSADREDGIVEIYDDTRTDTSAPVATFTFEDIENIVPCFTPGTTIATPMGERLVEDLREGDRVITRDNGLQEIRWIGRKELTGHQLARAPHLRPVLIQAGSLGPNLPEHDILVSPQHRMLINNDRSALYFEEREVLAAAKHLTDLDGVDEVGALGVTYIHFMFDQHEVVLSNGVWSESFQPGDQTMDGMGDAQRAEIFELFPELKTEDGLKDYAAARRSLKKHEAKLLVR